MNTRVRFYMTWNVVLVSDLEGAPFSKLEDFYALARGQLVTRFETCAPELQIFVADKSDRGVTMDIIWDVNLAAQPGAFHEPQDHADLAKAELMDGISAYARALDIEIYREAEAHEVQDHAEMLSTAVEMNIELTSDDYPVFRPERHPGWPEANEVFMQEGVWWWCAPANPRDPWASTGPSVGPNPVKIYAPWDPDYRARRDARLEVHAMRGAAA